MREIRFQAWDILEERMYDLTGFDIYEDRDETDDIYKPMIRLMGDELDETFLYGRIRLRQYTGLKDRNGTPIWESDIIKIYSTYTTDEPVEVVATVGFRDGAFDTDFHAMILKGCAKKGNWECEVIGNIYQDSHLLEGK